MGVRILLADPERMMREGLRRILAQRSDFEVVGEAADGDEAIRLAEELQPDIVLLEMILPRRSGVRVIEGIRSRGDSPRCLVLSSRQGRGWLEDAVSVGVSGYLPKDADSDELVQAIDIVNSGRLYFSPSISEHVVVGLNSRDQAPLSKLWTLSRREREVLELIADGLSTKEIAARLGVSPKTADTHRAGLMEKTGIHKAPRLVRFAIREGLVTP